MRVEQHLQGDGLVEFERIALRHRHRDHRHRPGQGGHIGQHVAGDGTRRDGHQHRLRTGGGEGLQPPAVGIGVRFVAQQDQRAGIAGLRAAALQVGVGEREVIQRLLFVASVGQATQRRFAQVGIVDAVLERRQVKRLVQAMEGPLQQGLPGLHAIGGRRPHLDP